MLAVSRSLVHLHKKQRLPSSCKLNYGFGILHESSDCSHSLHVLVFLQFAECRHFYVAGRDALLFNVNCAQDRKDSCSPSCGGGLRNDVDVFVLFVKFSSSTLSIFFVDQVLNFVEIATINKWKFQQYDRRNESGWEEGGEIIINFFPFRFSCVSLMAKLFAFIFAKFYALK